MEQLLIVFKYTGSFFAACYGVYATLTDFRPEKNGKKRLSRKGYFGIGLLVLSSVLALSADGLTDYKETKDQQAADESERRSREAARVRDETITARLSDQLFRLEGLSSSFTVASEKLDANSRATNKISSNLGTQLNATARISHQLGTAVSELNRTSKTTSSVLGETISRIDSLDVYLYILVDPWRIKDESGRSILSVESQKVLEHDKIGKIDLSQADDDDDFAEPLARDLLTHYNDLRKQVFSHWAATITFNTFGKAPPALFDLSSLMPDMWTVHQGDGEVTGFNILEFSDEPYTFTDKHQGYRALVCIVKYSLPPNRYIGIRKFADLNGVEWAVNIHSNSDFLKLHSAVLSVGGTAGGPQVDMSEEDITSAGRGIFKGSKTIPTDYFR